MNQCRYRYRYSWTAAAAELRHRNRGRAQGQRHKPRFCKRCKHFHITREAQHYWPPRGRELAFYADPANKEKGQETDG